MQLISESKEGNRLKANSSLKAIGTGSELANKRSPSFIMENTEPEVRDWESALLRQSLLSLKVMDNFKYVENEIVVAKVRVMRPKAFEIKRTAILPTIYTTCEVKRGLGSGGIRKPS